MKNNNLNDYIYIIGILCACLTMIFICMVASAEEYQQIEEGVYQEIIPSNDDIDNESYEGSTEVYSSVFADGAEGDKEQKWKVKCEHRSQNYLTNINEILTIQI